MQRDQIPTLVHAWHRPSGLVVARRASDRKAVTAEDAAHQPGSALRLEFSKRDDHSVDNGVEYFDVVDCTHDRFGVQAP